MPDALASVAPASRRSVDGRAIASATAVRNGRASERGRSRSGKRRETNQLRWRALAWRVDLRGNRACPRLLLAVV